MERQAAVIFDGVLPWLLGSWIQPHQNIMFASVAFPCLPTCFFLDAIKEIHGKNTSLSIYPKKKKGRGNVPLPCRLHQFECRVFRLIER